MYTFYHTLAIAAIIKNEAPYILEWLSYHHAAGVTKFYIYDNGSTDDTIKILQPFIKSGVVELIDCPLKAGQLQAYQDAIVRSRFVCKYLAIIDADEFLVSVDGESLPAEVEKLMEKYPAAAGIGARWRCFGSSGEKKYRQEEVVKRFLWRAVDEFSPNCHIKSIFNPRLALYMPTPHHVQFIWGRCLMSMAGNIVPSYQLHEMQDGGIFTYHYFVKSMEEFSAKVKRGTADGTTERTEDIFDFYDRNEVYDDSARQYFAKWQAMPYHGKDKAQVDQINAVRRNEVLAGADCSLTEALCHFFHVFAEHSLEEDKQQIADFLLEKITDDEPVPMEQILFLADAVPEVLHALQTLPNGISINWIKALDNIFDDAMYVARTFYQLREVKELRYLKSMLALLKQDRRRP